MNFEEEARKRYLERGMRGRYDMRDILRQLKIEETNDGKLLPNAGQPLNCLKARVK